MTDAEALTDIANTAATADVRAAARQHIEARLGEVEQVVPAIHRLLLDVQRQLIRNDEWDGLDHPSDLTDRVICMANRLAPSRLRKENEMSDGAPWSEINEKGQQYLIERDRLRSQVERAHVILDSVGIRRRHLLDASERDGTVAGIDLLLTNRVEELVKQLATAQADLDTERRHRDAAEERLAALSIELDAAKNALALRALHTIPEPTDARAPHTT